MSIFDTEHVSTPLPLDRQPDATHQVIHRHRSRLRLFSSPDGKTLAALATIHTDGQAYEWSMLWPLLKAINWRYETIELRPKSSEQLLSWMDWALPHGHPASTGVVYYDHASVFLASTPPRFAHRQHIWYCWDDRLSNTKPVDPFAQTRPANMRQGFAFARSHIGGLQEMRPGDRRSPWQRHYRGSPVACTSTEAHTTTALWQAATEEYLQRASDTPRYHIHLKDHCIDPHITEYDRHTLSQSALVFMLRWKDKPLQSLVVDVAERRIIDACITHGSVTWHPDAVTAWHKAKAEYAIARAPIRPMPDIMRMAWVDESTMVRCRKSFAGCQAGESYPVDTASLTFQWHSTKTHASGDTSETMRRGRELMIMVETPRGRIRFVAAHCFGPEIIWDQKYDLASMHTLDLFLIHFEVPASPSIAETHLSEYQAHRRTIHCIERFLSQSKS